MGTLERLGSLLPQEAALAMAGVGSALTEVRLRAGRPVQLRSVSGRETRAGVVDGPELRRIAASLMDHSLYAREAELAQGFFTMPDGCRVGVCGRLLPGTIGEIGSICVRVCRQVPGCAQALVPWAMDRETGALHSILILSPPGMGKTTCLRDLALQLSTKGRCVAVADERHELAACRDGAPTLDVGPCTDVMDGGPKAESIAHLLRAMAPEVIVTDELGAPEDAGAVAEATRCGVAVIASAHAADLGAALRRRTLRDVLAEGAFERVAVLGGAPGNLLFVGAWPEAAA